MLTKICERFDLIAIQEVQDRLDGLNHIKEQLGGDYGMVVSDITGSTPGSASPVERLAFLFRWAKVARTEVASDISYDRSAVVGTLYDGRLDFWRSFDTFTTKLSDWEADRARRGLEGRKPRTKPVVRLPRFVTFIRQPLCVSFRVDGAAGAEPYEFLAINAHLLYGRYIAERRMEFEALIGWLVNRAKQRARMYTPNIILFGDLNLDFKKADRRRKQVEDWLKSLNKTELAGAEAATIYFPFFDAHPRRGTGYRFDETGVFRTNARLDQTYDQIALVVHDARLPNPEVRATAGAQPDGFNYRVFDFVDLFAQALHGRHHAELGDDEQDELVKRFEPDLTDHMPIWIRLPEPR